MKDPPPARRLRKSRGAPWPRDHQLAQVRKRRDPIVCPCLRVLAADEGPAWRLQAVLVRALDRAHERGRDLALARPHEDRFGADWDRGASPMLETEERHALSVDGDVDILEAGALTEERLDRDHVLAVHGEVVSHDHSAARPIRRALDMVPRMLGDVDRVRILGGLRQGVRVADSDPAHLGRGPQVRLEERGRETLRVRHVVEGAEVRVRGQPAARVDLESKKIADHAFVFRPVQPLEASRTGIPVTGRFLVDHGLEGLDQGAQRVRRRPALARRGHHPGAQLPDHLLRRRGTARARSPRRIPPASGSRAAGVRCDSEHSSVARRRSGLPRRRRPCRRWPRHRWPRCRWPCRRWPPRRCPGRALRGPDRTHDPPRAAP